MTIEEWVLKHGSWVFSGIGVSIIGYLVSRFLSRRNKMPDKAMRTQGTVNIDATSSGSGIAKVATGDIVFGDKYAAPDERITLLKEARKDAETIDTSILADVFRPGADVLATFNRFLPGAAVALRIYDRVRPYLEEERSARLDVYLAKHKEFQKEVLLNANKYTPEMLKESQQPAAEMLIKNVGNLWEFVEALKKELSEQIRDLV